MWRGFIRGEHTEEGKKSNGEGAQDIQAQGKTEEEQKEEEKFDKTAEPKIEKERSSIVWDSWLCNSNPNGGKVVKT